MIRALVILATVLSWGVARAADQAVAPLSFVAGKLQMSSADSGFLATGSSLSCSSSPGKLIVDSTADTLAWCSSGGSTVKQAALGNDNGEATSIAPLTIDAGDIQSGVIPPSKMTESFMQSYVGTGLAFDTTTSPDSLKVAADGVALGANTTGNYVATIAGTANEVSVSGSGSETAAVTVGLPSAIDLGGKTSFEVPNGASPTTNVFGQVAGDNDAWAASRGALQWYDGTASTFLIGALASDPPTNWQVPRWNSGGTITWENSDRAVTAASLGLHCAYSANDTATLRAALESGGAAAGKTLFIPSGCKILLGTPGSGDSVADVASNTTIECEDQTAGFVLARKSCSDASNTPGAACTADNQCKSGTCDPDYAAGTSFAPTAADTYTVFGAASGTENIAIRNCSIWTNAASGDTPAMGGAGKRWGYCDGSGTSIAGEGCYNACNSSSGAFEGFACLANTDCNAGGAGSPGSCVAVAGNCKSLGGTCGSIPYSTNAGAAGPGKINPISWANASNARVENVAIYDLRRGDAAIDIGVGGVVTDSTTTANSLTTAQVAASILGSNSWLIGTGRHTCSFLSTYTGCQTPTLAKGIVSNGAKIIRSTAYGWTAGIQAKTNTHLIHSTGGGYGDPSQTGWNGNADLLISGSNVQADNFVGGTSLYCVLPEFAVGYNFQVSQPYCDNNIGPKFIVQNAGNQYLGVRGAWNGRGAIVGLSEQRGICASGTRSGKVCVFGAGNDATIGCPTGGTCAADDAFPAGPANHFILAGGGLLHSDQGSTVTFLRAPDSKRCTNPGATDYGGPCSSDGDCSTGLCDYLYWVNGLIDGTLFYNGTGTTAVDLSTTGVGVSKTTASPSISNWVVSGVDLQGFSTGFKFPSISRSCVSGSNDGTSCTADATCTGGGKCKAQVENFVASGNVGTTTTPLLNWDWSYGDVSGLKGLLATDDQGTVITLTAGEALTRGQLVSVSTSTDNAVVKTTTANPERGLGVALADTLSGYRAKVLTQGIGACIADGTISNGDQLKPSGSTSGRVVTISSTADPIVGRALDSATSGQTFDCLVGTAPPIQNSSAIFPKFAESHSTGTTSGVICSSATALATITYTATSGHLVRLQGYVPLDITGSVTRVFTTFITRGGSSCTAGSPTTLVTADSELTSNQNITAAIAYTDTGQSGSVTYRLCFCADTAASCQAGANAALLLTEY